MDKRRGLILRDVIKMNSNITSVLNKMNDSNQGPITNKTSQLKANKRFLSPESENYSLVNHKAMVRKAMPAPQVFSPRVVDVRSSEAHPLTMPKLVGPQSGTSIGKKGPGSSMRVSSDHQTNTYQAPMHARYGSQIKPGKNMLQERGMNRYDSNEISFKNKANRGQKKWHHTYLSAQRNASREVLFKSKEMDTV